MTNSDELFLKWQTCWIENTRTCLGCALEERIDEVAFLDEFTRAYQTADTKMRENNTKNFKGKGKFLAILIVWGIFQAVLFLGAVCAVFHEPILNGAAVSDFAVLSTLLILVFFAALFTVNKHLDFRKYQETWARHTYAWQQYRHLMLCYLNGIYFSEPASPEARRAFKISAIYIMDENVKKFAENMEKKEKDLLYGFPLGK
ncbi:hypothetical protein [Lawsonibacter sp. JLR.KK007]|jgi:hypothetical protein|uniref:hypothetical protein n=1 Tax=Lawsonibacter sp. JLR.KK007 TaxID=3114293 RepID=UPI002FF15451